MRQGEIFVHCHVSADIAILINILEVLSQIKYG